jgi:hypothetical protein
MVVFEVVFKLRVPEEMELTEGDVRRRIALSLAQLDEEMVGASPRLEVVLVDVRRA